MTLSLSLRLVSGQAPFRRRVQVWAKSVRIVQGERPDHVMAWREAVMGRFRRRVEGAHQTNAAEIRRLHVWDACFTGDGRGNFLEHYHGPWRSGDDAVCKANSVEGALQFYSFLTSPLQALGSHPWSCVKSMIIAETSINCYNIEYSIPRGVGKV